MSSGTIFEICVRLFMEQVHFFNVIIRLANDGEIILLNLELELNDKLELMCMNVLCKASMRFIIKIQFKLS